MKEPTPSVNPTGKRAGRAGMIALAAALLSAVLQAFAFLTVAAKGPHLQLLGITSPSTAVRIAMVGLVASFIALLAGLLAFALSFHARRMAHAEGVRIAVANRRVALAIAAILIPFLSFLIF